MTDKNVDPGATQDRLKITGTRVIGILPAGSSVCVFMGRFLVAGPSHAPYFLNMDGTKEPVGSC